MRLYGWEEKEGDRLEDKEIIALFRARSQQAIEELDHAYGPLVRSLARNFLSDARDAEEAVSDTYLALWDSIPPNEPELLRPYVCRVARNVCIARLRRLTAQKRNGACDEVLDELAELIPARETVESTFDAKELSAAVDRFLDEVSYDDRYLFMRRYWYADSVSEIAKAMGLGPHRVTVRLSRIRKRLYDYLKKEGLL